MLTTFHPTAGDTTDVQEIGEDNLSDLNAHEGLIVGVLTVFGLGDSAGYGDNFSDAIEEIHDVFSSAGAKMIAYVPTEEYQFEASRAVRGGKFLGSVSYTHLTLPTKRIV